MDGIVLTWLILKLLFFFFAVYSATKEWLDKTYVEKCKALGWNWGTLLVVLSLAHLRGLYIPFLYENGVKVGGFIFASAISLGMSSGIVVALIYIYAGSFIRDLHK